MRLEIFKEKEVVKYLHSDVEKKRPIKSKTPVMSQPSIVR
jgi:hypothetical protein